MPIGRKLPGDALIAPYHRPEKVNILVVGGETSPLWKVSDFDHTMTASIDKWRAKAPTARRAAVTGNWTRRRARTKLPKTDLKISMTGRQPPKLPAIPLGGGESQRDCLPRRPGSKR